MRIAILGGGGFRVPLVYSALARAHDRVDTTEVVLQDTDASRLRTMAAVLDGLAADLPHAPRVSLAPDLDSAVDGIDVVFSAIRVGGTHGRTVDERVALDLGLLGQETIGAGGLAYALRTVPVMDHVAARIAALAPQAWTINFTNPAGIITEAMRTHLGDRVIGICDTPIGLVRRVARTLGVALDRTVVDYVGLNHLGWLHSLVVDGVDRLPELLADDGLLASIEEARTLGPEWVRALGAIPNEYLYYYYYAREAAARISRAEQTRGEFLDAQQSTFYARAGTGAGSARAAWDQTLHEREATYMAEARDGEREQADVEGGGYHEVAVDLMAALRSGERASMILDVANKGIIPTLPDDAVIEVPCRVDSAGVHPMTPPTPLSLDELGLVTAVKAADRQLIEAARTGSRELAWRAFGTHPLVDSVDLARRLVDGYLAASPQIAAVLHAA
ncbi:6-phospho-beta-glucosidase [Occultella glacieicola]|uniref:6-phospho-beta-glucosidase n=1 Tax=Occultella glacieicola TaxID=2518684 RepID=A0ABY2E6R9_9MICO|nr:6-phospho-beta-glucosidase [Occultella glacieicola]TDE97246.1 6-phospho-beta-glucosidase [Occultella glacieicola]